MSGSAGSGGTAGTGGTGGDGGTSGNAGTAGTGGTSPEVAKSCVYTCEQDSDCVIPGLDAQDCNDVTKVCDFCVDNDDCLPSTSGWMLGCEKSEDCGDPLLVCVDHDGAAFCAIDSTQLACLAEEFTVSLPLHEGGGNADVCANAYARCAAGSCKLSCSSLTNACQPGQGDTCNPTTGLCECANDNECDTGACVNSHCVQCAGDQDCKDLNAGLDICIDGKCGCSSATSCIDQGYDGAVTTCR
jgi:hypothetical protein